MSSDPREEPEAPVVDFESRRSASDDEPRGDALDAILGRLAEIATGLQQLIDVQFSRARLELRERIFTALRWTLVGLLLATLTVVAAIYLLRGVAGLTEDLLSENLPWAGDLVAGAAGLLIVTAIGMIIRMRARRAGLRRLRAKFPEEGE